MANIELIAEIEPKNAAFEYMLDGKYIRGMRWFATNLTGSTLSGHKVVTISDTTGGMIYADSTNIDHAGFVLGLTTSSIANNVKHWAQSTGVVTEPGWSWTAGDELYLNTTGDLAVYGSLSGSRLFDRRVGVAISATSIVLDIQLSIIK